jgi:simple sugar transport system permease protein
MTGRGTIGTAASGRLWSGGIAIGIALIVTVVLLTLGSNTPGEALRAFFVTPLTNRYYVGNLLSSMGNLLVAGLGIVIAFRAGLYNLGGEGQIYASALAGTVAGLALPQAAGPLGALVVVLVAMATGGLLAGLSGALRHFFRAPEIITSFLLSAAVIPLVDYLITGPFNDPDRNLIATRTLPESFWLPRLLVPSELSLALVIAVALAGVVFLVLYRTVPGYELRLFGLNNEFARYAGINTGAHTVGAMAVSGALHGLCGGLMVLGTYHAAISAFSGGIGWNAIAVALIARLHPLAAIASALVFSYLEAGAKASMLHTEFTFELATIIQGVVFLFVTAHLFLRRRR